MHVIIDIDLNKLPEGAGASSLHLRYTRRSYASVTMSVRTWT